MLGVPRLLSAGQLEMQAEQSWGIRGAASEPGGLQKARVLGLSERRGFQGGRWRRAEREDGSLGETTIGVWGDHPPGDTEGAGGLAHSWPAPVMACFLSGTFPVLQHPLTQLFIHIEKDLSPWIIVGFTRTPLIRERNMDFVSCCRYKKM